MKFYIKVDTGHTGRCTGEKGLCIIKHTQDEDMLGDIATESVGIMAYTLFSWLYSTATYCTVDLQ